MHVRECACGYKMCECVYFICMYAKMERIYMFGCDVSVVCLCECESMCKWVYIYSYDTWHRDICEYSHRDVYIYYDDVVYLCYI